jgi:hypothetical protein
VAREHHPDGTLRPGLVEQRFEHIEAVAFAEADVDNDHIRLQDFDVSDRRFRGAGIADNPRPYGPRSASAESGDIIAESSTK